MNQRSKICLNSFPVRSLDEEALTVDVYKYSFKQQPEGTEIYKAVNNILYNIGGVVGAKLGSKIVTLQPIAERNLQEENWTLQHLGKQLLNPKNSVERKTLEQLYRRDFYLSLRRINQIQVEKYQTGFILWEQSKVELAGEGWQALKGALVDVAIDDNGQLNLEIDSHYRFYSPWTVHQWLEKYPDIPINYVHNLDRKYSWYFVDVSQEHPNDIMIKDLGISLADYHRKKGVLEQIIQESCVVYVRHTKKSNRQKQPTPHLSKLLQPSVSMEILSYVAEKGDRGAAEILTKVRLPIQERLEKGKAIAKSLLKNVYKIEETPEPQQQTATLFPQPILIAYNNTIVQRPSDALRKGCLRVGETQFGCLNLKQKNGEWPELIQQQLLKTAQASGTKIDLTYQCSGDELPDKDIARHQFWSSISDNNIKTMLVVSDWLGRQYKTQLRREALQAGIALQFMLPMPKSDPYRAANIILGLLVKAGWQPIGIQMPNHQEVAELTIGFDAGTNGRLFYGTSAFAVLADGQSIGWEIPEAQVGERFSQQAIYQATFNIVERFYKLNNRNPERVLLLRDGFVQDLEFGHTINWLEKEENIAVDLLEVHKSGAGRMAQRTETGKFYEVKPGTGFSIAEDAFRIVTSKAQAGGSARPLEVVKVHGDASLRVLAHQIFALSEFHPASAYASSRLPMPLHYADRMIKEVQRLGQLNILHGIDNKKIFAA